MSKQKIEIDELIELGFGSVFRRPRHIIVDREGNSAHSPTDEVDIMHMSFIVQPFLLCSTKEYNSFMHKYNPEEHAEIDQDYNIVDDCIKEHYEYITETVGPQKNMRIMNLLQDLLKEYGTIVDFKFIILGNHSIEFKYFSDSTLMSKKVSYSDTYRVELILLPKCGNRTMEFGDHIDKWILSILPLYKKRQPSFHNYTWIDAHTIDKFPYLHDHKGFIIEHNPGSPYNERPPIGIGLWYECVVY